MTLETFLTYCKFYTRVHVYHGNLLIDKGSAFSLLHTEFNGIVSRLDYEVDYFTIDGNGNLICVLCD